MLKKGHSFRLAQLILKISAGEKGKEGGKGRERKGERKISRKAAST